MPCVRFDTGGGYMTGSSRVRERRVSVSESERVEEVRARSKEGVAHTHTILCTVLALALAHLHGTLATLLTLFFLCVWCSSTNISCCPSCIMCFRVVSELSCSIAIVSVGRTRCRVCIFQCFLCVVCVCVCVYLSGCECLCASLCLSLSLSLCLSVCLLVSVPVSSVSAPIILRCVFAHHFVCVCAYVQIAPTRCGVC
jgi:hypothetical protein